MVSVQCRGGGVAGSWQFGQKAGENVSGGINVGPVVTASRATLSSLPCDGRMPLHNKDTGTSRGDSLSGEGLGNSGSEAASSSWPSGAAAGGRDRVPVPCSLRQGEVALTFSPCLRLLLTAPCPHSAPCRQSRPGGRCAGWPE